MNKIDKNSGILKETVEHFRETLDFNALLIFNRN